MGMNLPIMLKGAGILNGVMGLAGESGECVDLLKKSLFQGHPLDKEHMAKELGDVAWYLAVSAYGIGYDLETIFQMNVDKLRERYPDGFDPERSQHRKPGDV
jgi:NTP pyrophosphatase (non-canonical NTP hydrolase)